MSRRKVLVKRLVCIEDLGNVDVLFTDKTGTLTSGRIDYMRALPAGATTAGRRAPMPGCCAPRSRSGRPDVGGNALDQALWRSPAAARVAAALAGYAGTACCRSTTNG